MAPMMAAGNTAKSAAMEPAKKSPRTISIVPSMMFVPPVRAPK
jgi:hypothetical protein